MLLGLLFLSSCRKYDLGIAKTEKQISVDRFFKVPESADSRLKSIARSIKAQEKEHPFLENFIKKTPSKQLFIIYFTNYIHGFAFKY